MNSELKKFLNDLNLVDRVSTRRNHQSLLLPEYPFDKQLLNLSSLYRRSRELYLAQGGQFLPRVSSTARGLSRHDIFKNEIEFTPSRSELEWFREIGHNMKDALGEFQALTRFNEISLFHEQNHRIIWTLLPPAPKGATAFRQFLNLAESLTIALDFALGDEVGREVSRALVRLKLIYMPSGDDNYAARSKKEYRRYLQATQMATYLTLERTHQNEIVDLVGRTFTTQEKLNRAAIRRSSMLNRTFTEVTNPLWQQIHAKSARAKLRRLERTFKNEGPLKISNNPLGFTSAAKVADRVFSAYGI